MSLLERMRPSFELQLPPTEQAPAEARRSLDRLDGHLDPDGLETMRLLVSELFTNSVKYGARRDGARIRLSIAVTDEHARVEIGDHGRGFDEGEVPMPDFETESGRGLAFLDALADRWGVVRNGETCVWFELHF